MSSFADEWFALFGEEIPVDDPSVYHPFTSSFHDHLVIDLTTEPNDGQTAVEDDLQLFEQLDIHENTRNLRLVQQDGQPTNADDSQIFEQLKISETTQKRVFVQQDETEEENRLNHENHFPHIYRTEPKKFVGCKQPDLDYSLLSKFRPQIAPWHDQGSRVHQDEPSCGVCEDCTRHDNCNETSCLHGEDLWICKHGEICKYKNVNYNSHGHRWLPNVVHQRMEIIAKEDGKAYDAHILKLACDPATRNFVTDKQIEDIRVWPTFHQFDHNWAFTKSYFGPGITYNGIGNADRFGVFCCVECFDMTRLLEQDLVHGGNTGTYGDRNKGFSTFLGAQETIRRNIALRKEKEALLTKYLLEKMEWWQANYDRERAAAAAAATPAVAVAGSSAAVAVAVDDNDEEVSAPPPPPSAEADAAVAAAPVTSNSSKQPFRDEVMATNTFTAYENMILDKRVKVDGGVVRVDGVVVPLGPRLDLIDHLGYPMFREAFRGRRRGFVEDRWSGYWSAVRGRRVGR